MEFYMITVNKRNITEKEFDLACNEFITKTGKSKLSKDEMLRIANQIIDSVLLLDKAKKENLHITDDEVNKYIEGIKANYKTIDDFNNALNEIGDTLESFKHKIKDNIILRKYLKTIFYSKVVIKEDEVKDFYNKNEDYFYSGVKINASHILFNKADKEKAEEVRKEVLNGKVFSEMAKEYSQCPSKEKGGELGLFSMMMLKIR